MVPTVGLEPRIEDLIRFATLRLNHSATPTITLGTMIIFGLFFDAMVECVLVEKSLHPFPIHHPQVGAWREARGAVYRGKPLTLLPQNAVAHDTSHRGEGVSF